jgi:hypothetical protein
MLCVRGGQVQGGVGICSMRRVHGGNLFGYLRVCKLPYLWIEC